MSDDWKPGDLALCVRRPDYDEYPDTGWEVHVGGVYTVSDCGLEAFPWLDFEEDTGKAEDAAWAACDFRKIRPHTPDAEDAETIRLLTGKPATVNA